MNPVHLYLCILVFLGGLFLCLRSSPAATKLERVVRRWLGCYFFVLSICVAAGSLKILRPPAMAGVLTVCLLILAAVYWAAYRQATLDPHPKS